MRVAEALRTLLLELAESDDNTETGQAHQDRADDVIALLIHNRKAAGKVMCAMGSLIGHAWMENAHRLDPDEAVRLLCDRPAGGEPIPHLHEFMQSFIDGYRGGQKVSTTSAILAANITHSREYASLIIWLFGVYLTQGAPADRTQREQFVDHFVAASLRQHIISDDELDPPPPEPGH